MTDQPSDPRTDDDPDADPGNLNPRDEIDAEPLSEDEDPDADPGNLNPRDDLPTT